VKPDVDLGTLLAGTYRIVRRIGSGGMGEVYEATHERLAHRYAVKFLHPGMRDHPEALPRFMREAQVTSRLRHPGIVSVVDFNTLPNGQAYLVMEYLEGESLGEFLTRSGKLPLARVVDITDQLSSALTAAHKQGVVHRDMHPQNVFVVPGTGGQSERIKILDFGISKIASVSQKITGTAAVLGTPQYMSPEQAEGKTDQLDAAADQFSLAAIVYELLTGKPAFAGETLASVAYQVVHARPMPIATYRPELPVEIENVVLRGLSKNKKDRFPSVSEFAVHFRWTASLPMRELRRAPGADPAAPTPVAADTEETTAVSALPSGMAAVLRQSSLDLPLASSLLPEGGTGGKAGAPTDNEMTVVAGGAWTEIVQPAPRRRRLVVGAAIAGGVLVIAIVAGVALRARKPQTDRAPPATSEIATAAPPAAAPTPSPAAAEPAVAAAAPAAPDTPTPPASDPPTSDPPVIEGIGEQKSLGRSRPRATGTGKAPASVVGVGVGVGVGAKAGSVPGVCRITVGSYPWADLWIDGADTGQQTPVVGLPMSCGPHRLQFKRRDLRIDQIEHVMLNEGHEFKRQYELQGTGVDD
jgi:eukaryotic-like serine/threonine-protein kinase